MKLCLFGDAQSVHLHRLARGLAERGHHVYVVSHKPADVPGVTVDRFRVPSAGLNNIRRWKGRWAQYLRRFLQRFDVVNVHFLSDWGFTPEIMQHGCLVATAWGSDIVPPPGEDQPTIELVRARVNMLRHAAAATACGATFASMVADFADLPKDGVQVVPFGVDVDLFKPKQRDSNDDDGPFRVGFFKGFREVYGPTFLIRAMPLVLRECPSTRFELVGDGPQLAECKELAKTLGVDESVDWLPRQSHGDLPRILANWHVSVIPSVCEAFGVAALESSAAGVPVVASKVGGLCDTVLHDKTGCLVPAKSPELLAEALVALLKDGEARRQMAQQGRAWVSENFSASLVLDAWETFYARARDRVATMV